MTSGIIKVSRKRAKTAEETTICEERFVKNQLEPSYSTKPMEFVSDANYNACFAIYVQSPDGTERRLGERTEIASPRLFTNHAQRELVIPVEDAGSQVGTLTVTTDFGRNDTVPRPAATTLVKHPMLKVNVLCEFQSAMTSSIKVSFQGENVNGALIDSDKLKTSVKNEKRADFGSVRFEYMFEVDQIVCFEISVLDADGQETVHGTAKIALTQLLTNDEQKEVPVMVRDSGGATGTKLFLTADRIGEVDHFDFQFEANGLPRPNGFFSKANPYYEIEGKGSDAQAIICRSKCIKNTLTPEWERQSIPQQWLDDGKLKITVWHRDEFSEPKLIGTVHPKKKRKPIEVKHLIEAEPDSLAKLDFVIEDTSSHRIRGNFVIKRFEKAQRPCFLQYMCGGLKLKLSMAIDFTASNRQPEDSASLHCPVILDKEDNEIQCRTTYEKVIRSLGTILERYDDDNFIPVYGFGAKFRRNGSYDNSKTLHCFPVHRKDVEAKGVQGIIDAYRQLVSSRHIKFDGPTFFSDCISRLATEVETRIEEGKCTQEDLEYHVLIIISDGKVTDLHCTIQQIVRCSYLPISIIIVGVGNVSSQNMEMIDGDDTLLIDKFGNRALRDIVQFVDFSRLGGDPNRLSIEALSELPDQVLSYMQYKSFKPPRRDVDLYTRSQERMRARKYLLSERKESEML